MPLRSANPKLNDPFALLPAYARRSVQPPAPIVTAPPIPAIAAPQVPTLPQPTTTTRESPDYTQELASLIESEGGVTPNVLEAIAEIESYADRPLSIFHRIFAPTRSKITEYARSPRFKIFAATARDAAEQHEALLRAREAAAEAERRRNEFVNSVLFGNETEQPDNYVEKPKKPEPSGASDQFYDRLAYLVSLGILSPERASELRAERSKAFDERLDLIREKRLAEEATTARLNAMREASQFIVNNRYKREEHKDSLIARGVPPQLAEKYSKDLASGNTDPLTEILVDSYTGRWTTRDQIIKRLETLMDFYNAEDIPKDAQKSVREAITTLTQQMIGVPGAGGPIGADLKAFLDALAGVGAGAGGAGGGGGAPAASTSQSAQPTAPPIFDVVGKTINEAGRGIGAGIRYGANLASYGLRSKFGSLPQTREGVKQVYGDSVASRLPADFDTRPASEKEYLIGQAVQEFSIGDNTPALPKYSAETFANQLVDQYGDEIGGFLAAHIPAGFDQMDPNQQEQVIANIINLANRPDIEDIVNRAMSGGAL